MRARLRRLGAAALLAVATMGVTSGVAHAAAYGGSSSFQSPCTFGPTITGKGGATNLGGSIKGWFDVSGTCFTPGGGVWVGVFSADGSVLYSQNLTNEASSYSGNQFEVYEVMNGACFRNARAIAYDWTTGTYSNSATFDIGPC